VSLREEDGKMVDGRWVYGYMAATLWVLWPRGQRVGGRKATPLARRKDNILRVIVTHMQARARMANKEILEV